MIDTLNRLYEQYCSQMRAAADGGARTPDQLFAAMGIDRAGFIEGVNEFKQLVSNDLTAEDAGILTAEDAGIAFAFAFARGHAAGIRRAAMAASFPEARGREAELFGWLLAGHSVEAATARLRSKPTPLPQDSGNVITLPIKNR